MFNWQPGRNPWDVDYDERGEPVESGPPAQRPPAVPSQPFAPMQAPAQDRASNAGAARAERETDNLPSPQQAGQINAAAVARAQAEAMRAQAEAVAAQRALERGGLTPDAFEERRREAEGKLTAARNLQRQLDAMRAIYSEHFEGWGPRSFANSVFPTEPNQRFASLADTMSVDLKPLIRTPGEGVWTDRDQALLDRLTPRPDHWDSRNEETFNELQARIDAINSRYGQAAPQVQNSASGTNLSTQVQVNESQPERRTPDNRSATREVNDPVTRGHVMRVSQMLGNGVPTDTIMDYARRHLSGDGVQGIERLANERYRRDSDTARWMRQNPGRPFPVDPAWWRRTEERSGLEQTMGAVLDTPVGTGAATYLNSLLAGWGPDAAGLVGGDPETIRAGLEGARAQNPTSALLGDIGGAVGAYGVAGRVARNLGVLSNAPRTRAVLGDAAYGTAYGAGSNPDDRLGGAAMGAVLQAGGGAAGRALFNTAGNLVRGVRNPSVQRLRAEGAELPVGSTVGQSGIAGESIRAIQNASTSVPVIGRMATARQVEARAQWNQARWNEALRPIGGRVSVVGEEASEAAWTQVAQAYNNVFQGRTFTLDPQMRQAINNQSQRIRTILPDFQGDMAHIINQQVRPMLAAGDIQSAHRVLRDARAMFAGKPGAESAIRSIGTLQASLERMIQRQHPGAYRALQNANRAHRLVSTLQAAQQAAINNADSPGIFTPAQLGAASRQNANRFGGRDLAASTRRPFYQSQRDAQTVLPNNIPNSGTADRLAALGLLGGVAGGAEWADLPGMELGGGGLGIMALLNSRGGQRLVNGMLAARSRGAREFGEQFLNRPISIYGPQLAPPFRTQMTAPQFGGVGFGTAINSMGGMQGDGRPFGPFQ